VSEGIDERLTGDEHCLLADDRMQVTGDPLNRRPKMRRLLYRQLFAQDRKGLRQVGIVARRGAQILHPITTFGQHLVGTVQRLL
jgi:hypothetical protein